MCATLSDSRDEEFAASAGWLVSSATKTSLAEDKYCPEGCQRIHREAGEVCDIFIPDFCKEGIKHLSQINAWSFKRLKQINTPTIIWYFTVVPVSSARAEQ